MTTLRRELREALQWCLKQRHSFKSSDMQSALNTDRYLANKKLRVFTELGLLEREQHGGSGMPYTYTICDRELAESLANETPLRIRVKRVTTRRSNWSGASSIFGMGV